MSSDERLSISICGNKNKFRLVVVTLGGAVTLGVVVVRR